MGYVRLILIVTVLLFAYSVIVVALLFPLLGFFIAIVLVATLCKRGNYYSAFGTARWAGLSDLEGMTDGGNGLIIGEVQETTSFLTAIKNLFNRTVPSEVAVRQFFQSPKKPYRKLVRLNKAVSTAVFAPTGVGKTVSCAVVHLLTCPDSIVILDYKGEIATITAEARRKMGQKVVILDPFKLVTKTPDTFNPLEFIDASSLLALDECRDLAAAMVVRTGQEKDPHWADSAELWITAMLTTVCAFAEPKDKSLQAVRDLLTDTKKMEGVIRLMCESTVWGGMLARLGHQLTHFKDKELGSTLTTTNRFLRFLDTMAIFDSTKTSSFNPADLLKGKMTVYLVIPPDHMTAQSALLRLWISSLLKAVVRGGLQERHKVHFVLDEAASLGKMDILTDAVNVYRGFGVRLQLYYQSLGQLKRCWPDGQDQTLLSNVSQVFFGVNDNETAKYVSERLGKETLVIASGGRGTSASRTNSQQAQGHSRSYSSSTSDNWQQSGRELLQPNEVMALNERIAITFTPGIPPIATRLVRYYEKAFTNKPGMFWPAIKAFVFSLCFLSFALACAGMVTRAAQIPAGNFNRGHVINPTLLGK